MSLRSILFSWTRWKCSSNLASAFWAHFIPLRPVMWINKLNPPYWELNVIFWSSVIFPLWAAPNLLYSIYRPIGIFEDATGIKLSRYLCPIGLWNCVEEWTLTQCPARICNSQWKKRLRASRKLLHGAFRRYTHSVLRVTNNLLMTGTVVQGNMEFMPL